MTVVQRAIIAELNASIRTKDEVRFQKLFQHVVDNLENPVSLGPSRRGVVSHDVYLFCAETAIVLKQYEIAGHCMSRLLEDPPTRTDFVIRFHYICAQVRSHA